MYSRMPYDMNDAPSTEWLPLPVDGRKGEAAGVLPREQLRRWCLVLDAMQIDYRRENGWRGTRLLVLQQDLDRALAQIAKFEAENRDWPPSPPAELKSHGSILVTLSVIFLLASFHNLTQTQLNLPLLGSPDWYSMGSAYAGKIRQGELWRAVTALTLHSDFQHLAGNAAVATLFIEQLRKRYGSGAAWLLFMLSGIFGNTVNALLQPWHHQSVGASTAVFGLLGIIAADSFIRYRNVLMRRWALPLAAAAALLGFLGTSGEHTDLGAHLWGFACGIAMGLLCASRWRDRLPPSPGLNRFLALISCLLPTLAWLIAIMPA